jgi:hypothetical protein
MNQEEVNQVVSDVDKLKIEMKRLRAIEHQVRYYLSSDGDTYQAYLKLCEVCGLPPEEPEEIDEYVGQLEAEIKRLRLYTNPRLFAAASGVLEAWDDYNQVSIPSLIEALEESFIPRLIEAVAWWDSLPFDPEKDAEKLPKYEG